jgi:hypothetical protein
MTTEEYSKLPKDIKAIIDSFNSNDASQLYFECERVKKELDYKGWTCDFKLECIDSELHAYTILIDVQQSNVC